MAAQRKAIAEKLDNDEKWEQLFQKTIEAIELFGERRVSQAAKAL